MTRGRPIDERLSFRPGFVVGIVVALVVFQVGMGSEAVGVLALGFLPAIVAREAARTVVTLAVGADATVTFSPVGGGNRQDGLLSPARRAAVASAGVLGSLVPASVVGAIALALGRAPDWWPATGHPVVVGGVIIALINLLPIPGLDGFRLVQLAVNDQGHPARRDAVTALGGVTLIAVLIAAFMADKPVTVVVVLLLGFCGFGGRFRDPDPRQLGLMRADLARDAERLVALANAEASSTDGLGLALAAEARRRAAVALAQRDRYGDADALLLGTADTDAPERLAVELLRDPRGGAERLARWVAERTRSTLPPTWVERPDVIDRLLAGAVQRAPRLSLSDHHLLGRILLDARQWLPADMVAASLHQRGGGPDAALLRSLVRGGGRDPGAAYTWLMEARRAGGDVREWASYAAELEHLRDDPRVRALVRGVSGEGRRHEREWAET